MTTKKDLPQLIIHGTKGNDITFTYKTMQDLVYDMKYYLPRVFPHLKEPLKKKLNELYQ